MKNILSIWMNMQLWFDKFLFDIMIIFVKCENLDFAVGIINLADHSCCFLCRTKLKSFYNHFPNLQETSSSSPKLGR